ncbi:helix-turn-helix domain-containing protein [Rathayibacter sp. VKM Ac-2760]|uniref:PucR family transcriptional regulator n=1 Tax=Rathayibacter sp. VKM Ac-2760 TaxID=2609253 RepID=UPI0013174829|nr:helix-turn-helix domain-containing protein [Rathayibacter sp. VKM Ac-2760]QHC57484.1 hypothetical protein GSU72_01980 [Rathayibacter sp. VKM Ac-2760]
MNVRELLTHPELQLTLVSGDDVQLSRAVSGTYTIDLPDPGRFLSPGDVVLTSALWTSGRESVERFVGGVADRGVVAIVVGLIAVGSLPAGMLEVCRRHGVVLMTVAPDVSFKTIAQTVAGVIAHADLPTLGREARFARRLLADPAPGDPASGEGVQVALRAFFEEFAHGSWAVDRAGTLVASAGGLPAPAEYGAAWEASLAVPDGRWAVTGHGRSLSRRALFSAAGERLGVLVVTGDQRGWSEETADAVELLAGAVAGRLDLARRRELAATEPLLGLLRALLHDELPESEIAVRLRMLGVGLGEPLRVVVARSDDPALPPEALLEPLRAASDRAPALGTVLDGAAVLLLGEADSPPGPVLRAALEAAPWLLHGRRVVIGIGDASSLVSQLGVSLLAARERAGRGSRGEAVSVVEHTVPVSSDDLLELVAPRTRAAFALAVLGPLVQYDEEHRSDMVETLRVFLESGGSWRQAADRLHLHASTLRYRVQRIEALTGRDLSAMTDRVDLHLALRHLPAPRS